MSQKGVRVFINIATVKICGKEDQFRHFCNAEICSYLARYKVVNFESPNQDGSSFLFLLLLPIHLACFISFLYHIST